MKYHILSLSIGLCLFSGLSTLSAATETRPTKIVLNCSNTTQGADLYKEKGRCGESSGIDHWNSEISQDGISAARQALTSAYDSTCRGQYGTSDYQICHDKFLCETGWTYVRNTTNCTRTIQNPTTPAEKFGIPVNGGWSDFSSWSSCTGGSQTRSRSCNTPTPANGGAYCSGNSYESRNCTTAITPVTPAPSTKRNCNYQSNVTVGLWNNTAKTLPVTGMMYSELHYSTTDFPGFPITDTDRISTHVSAGCSLIRSRYASFFPNISTDCREIYHQLGSPRWTPPEGGGTAGQGARGDQKPTPEQEMWQGNMPYSYGLPPAGTKYIVKNPRTGKAVVLSMGFEIGANYPYIGGMVAEPSYYLGNDSASDFVLGEAVDQSLPYGPLLCDENASGVAPTQPSTPVRVNGGWSDFGSWSNCTGGSQARSRLCNNPTPGNGGSYCSGDSYESRSCSIAVTLSVPTFPTPVVPSGYISTPIRSALNCTQEGLVASWYKTKGRCGDQEGLDYWTRAIEYQGASTIKAIFEGIYKSDCSSRHGTTDYATCHTRAFCPTTGGWSYLARSTVCIRPQMTVTPVNGGWSAFGSWSNCVNSTQSRSRLCNNPTPVNGGSQCVGGKIETRSCSVTVTPPTTSTQKNNGFWVTGYQPAYNNWSAQGDDYKMLSLIVHFAAIPNTDGSLEVGANGMSPEKKRAAVAQAHANNTAIVLDIRSDEGIARTLSAMNASNRSRFVSAIMNEIDTYGYDGVDLDFEPIGNVADFGALAKDLDRELRKKNNIYGTKRYLTTSIMPGADGGKEVRALAASASYFDQINLMVYDVDGPWSELTAFDSGLRGGWSVDMLVQGTLDAGIPAKKIGLGMSLDFKCDPYSGASRVGQTKQRRSGSDNHWIAPTEMLNSPAYNPANLIWDDTAKMYSLDISEARYDFCTYNGERGLQEKVKYAKEKGLGGVMIWNLALDPASRPLRSAIQSAVSGGTSSTPAARPTTSSSVTTTVVTTPVTPAISTQTPRSSSRPSIRRKVNIRR